MTRIDSYIPDKPIGIIRQDEFNRYDYAKRVAETIRDRHSPESLVVGLYGRWGEGKTSVLNFITAELKSARIITMTFNPWRFEGEDQLLTGFFTELAQALNKPLKTKGEAAGELLAQYAEAVIPKFQFLGGAVTTEPGAQVKKMGELLANTSLPELKQRLEKILREARKRVVIIIDDIDRLNRKEIQAVLRLVKLTGDFNYVTYLLSFDNVMVARAIGEAYEGGDEASGHSFLEKIIQVPLRLPAIQPDVMLRFFTKQIEKTLQLTNNSILREDWERFVSAARVSIIPMVTVPRHAVRYCNTLSFLLPLLQGETNPVDVMLIEALKLFYPHLHEFIASKQEAVTGIRRDSSENKHVQEQLDPILKADSSVIGHARGLLYTLFPKVRSVYSAHAMFSFDRARYRDEQEMERAKSIASSYYFKRYFSYAVQPGEIPDQRFASFIDLILQDNGSALYEEAIALSKDSNVSELIRRIRGLPEEVLFKHGVTICILIGQLSSKLSFDSSSIAWQFSSSYEIIHFVFSILNTLQLTERLSLASLLIRDSGSIKFSQLLLHEARYIAEGSEDEEGNVVQKPALFEEDQLKVLARVLIDRIIQESGEDAVYEKFEEDAEEIILDIWPQAYSPENTNDYVQERLSKKPNELLAFLRSVAARLSRGGGPFFPTHISPEIYQSIHNVLDSSYLYQIGLQLLGGAPIVSPKDDRRRQLTDEERLHQFMHLHEQHLASETGFEQEE